jgi:hypothetical protein
MLWLSFCTYVKNLGIMTEDAIIRNITLKKFQGGQKFQSEARGAHP